MGHQASPWWGCPIRTSADQSLLAAPRGLSQPSTSFIGSRCQGIHRAPFLARRLDLSTSPSRAGSMFSTFAFACSTTLHSSGAQKRPDPLGRKKSRLSQAVDTRDSRQEPMRLTTPVTDDPVLLGPTARHTPVGARVPRECSLYPTPRATVQVRWPSGAEGLEPLTSALQRRRSPS